MCGLIKFGILLPCHSLKTIPLELLLPKLVLRVTVKVNFWQQHFQKLHYSKSMQLNVQSKSIDQDHIGHINQKSSKPTCKNTTTSQPSNIFFQKTKFISTTHSCIHTNHFIKLYYFSVKVVRVQPKKTKKKKTKPDKSILPTRI